MINGRRSPGTSPAPAGTGGLPSEDAQTTLHAWRCKVKSAGDRDSVEGNQQKIGKDGYGDVGNGDWPPRNHHTSVMGLARCAQIPVVHKP
jgi:hypothetical protein